MLLEQPVPHWLIVSRGLTELGKKKGKNAAVSGRGFELTCRVPARFRTPEEDVAWVLSWMQALADYLAESGASFEAFHNKEMTKPTSEDEICALVFVDDVALAPSKSRNGKFSFLQMVGLTGGEHEALGSWAARPFVELLRSEDSLLLTDPKRTSYLRNEEFANRVELGRERDGSSVGMLLGVPILWFQEANELQVHTNADGVKAVRSALQHRLRHGKMMILLGDPRTREGADGAVVEHAQRTVVLLPEPGRSQLEDRDGMKAAVLRLVPEAMTQLLGILDAKPGSYSVLALAGVRFIVASTERFADEHYPW